MSPPAERAWRDPGLQQERTVLAYRRTGLALVAGVAGVARLTFSTFGVAVTLPAAMAGALAVWVVVATMRRGRLGAVSTHDDRFDSVLGDGRVPAVVAALTGGLAAGEVANVLVQLAGV